MALDGMFLRFLKKEVETEAVNSRVEKIYQPSREELVIVFRGQNGSRRFLLSARANSPRVQFTQYSPENPATPPMLCMLLRKKLSGARLIGVRRPGLERILFFDFDGTDEMGDPVKYTLCIEIMARHSNIILLDGEEKILDAVKRVDITTSSVRQVLPGLTYCLPPAQNKFDLLSCSTEEIVRAVRAEEAALSKALQKNLQGASPLICRELAELVCRDTQANTAALDDEAYQRLNFRLKKLKELLTDGAGEAVMVVDPTGRPMDFSFLNITQYGSKGITSEYESFSQLLDAFYTERDRLERTRQRAHDLLRVLSNATERISKKLNLQKEEMKACGDREKLRMYGDIINANLYSLEKGALFYDLQDFYNDNVSVRISADPSLTPSQNAQKYYKEYQKARTAEKMLEKLIEQNQRELEYIETVFDALSRADTERELSEIKEELAEQGYVKAVKGAKIKKTAPLKPIKYVSGDGYTILVGRNNRQNDKLTLREAAKNDFWFHTKNIPGSHVIVVSNGEEPPKKTLSQAALLAAYYSKARESSSVAVDYTQVKNVKKPQGAKPGLVIYENYSTAYVTPLREEVEQISRQ